MIYQNQILKYLSALNDDNLDVVNTSKECVKTIALENPSHFIQELLDIVKNQEIFENIKIMALKQIKYYYGKDKNNICLFDGLEKQEQINCYKVLINFLLQQREENVRQVSFKVFTHIYQSFLEDHKNEQHIYQHTFQKIHQKNIQYVDQLHKFLKFMIISDIKFKQCFEHDFSFTFDKLLQLQKDETINMYLDIFNELDIITILRNAKIMNQIIKQILVFLDNKAYKKSFFLFEKVCNILIINQKYLTFDSNDFAKIIQKLDDFSELYVLKFFYLYTTNLQLLFDHKQQFMNKDIIENLILKFMLFIEHLSKDKIMFEIVNSRLYHYFDLNELIKQFFFLLENNNSYLKLLQKIEEALANNTTENQILLLKYVQGHKNFYQQNFENYFQYSFNTLQESKLTQIYVIKNYFAYSKEQQYPIYEKKLAIFCQDENVVVQDYSFNTFVYILKKFKTNLGTCQEFIFDVLRQNIINYRMLKKNTILWYQKLLQSVCSKKIMKQKNEQYFQLIKQQLINDPIYCLEIYIGWLLCLVKLLRYQTYATQLVDEEFLFSRIIYLLKDLKKNELYKFTKLKLLYEFLKQNCIKSRQITQIVEFFINMFQKRLIKLEEKFIIPIIEILYKSINCSILLSRLSDSTNININYTKLTQNQFLKMANTYSIQENYKLQLVCLRYLDQFIQKIVQVNNPLFIKKCIIELNDFIQNMPNILDYNKILDTFSIFENLLKKIDQTKNTLSQIFKEMIINKQQYSKLVELYDQCYYLIGVFFCNIFQSQKASSIGGFEIINNMFQEKQNYQQYQLMMICKVLVGSVEYLGKYINEQILTTYLKFFLQQAKLQKDIVRYICIKGIGFLTLYLKEQFDKYIDDFIKVLCSEQDSTQINKKYINVLVVALSQFIKNVGHKMNQNRRQILIKYWLQKMPLQNDDITSICQNKFLLSYIILQPRQIIGESGENINQIVSILKNMYCQKQQKNKEINNLIEDCIKTIQENWDIQKYIQNQHLIAQNGRFLK